MPTGTPGSLDCTTIPTLLAGIGSPIATSSGPGRWFRTMTSAWLGKDMSRPLLADPNPASWRAVSIIPLFLDKRDLVIYWLVLRSWAHLGAWSSCFSAETLINVALTQPPADDPPGDRLRGPGPR